MPTNSALTPGVDCATMATSSHSGGLPCSDSVASFLGGLLSIVVVGGSATISAVETTGASPKPNIVMFYIDDAAPHDGRLWETPALTPAIHETFVARGIEFSNAFGEKPMCCPGRASLFTGLHSHNHGVVLNDARKFRPQEHLGRAMMDAGYASMCIGKYLNRNR